MNMQSGNAPTAAVLLRKQESRVARELLAALDSCFRRRTAFRASTFAKGPSASYNPATHPKDRKPGDDVA